MAPIPLDIEARGAIARAAIDAMCGVRDDVAELAQRFFKADRVIVSPSGDVWADGQWLEDGAAVAFVRWCMAD